MSDLETHVSLCCFVVGAVATLHQHLSDLETDVSSRTFSCLKESLVVMYIDFFIFEIGR